MGRHREDGDLQADDLEQSLSLVTLRGNQHGCTLILNFQSAELGEINSYCVSHPVHGALLWSPNTGEYNHCPHTDGAEIQTA